jgi:dienelactone hydrolase
MKNVDGMKARFMAAMEILKTNDEVDPARIGAIGYCFGGGVALNMACSGADLKGVVSFHAGLASVTPPQKGNLKASLLICNGAADKFNPDEVVKKFRAGLDSVKAVYKFINYADALHAFTNPVSTEAGKKFNIPLAYNEKADKQSWTDMQLFFKMVFAM